MTAPHYGATPRDWAHFSLILGLAPDLLTVVSNPHATISPTSKMKDLGKTPSRYNQNNHAVGIADWTSHVATDKDLDKWACEPDYGICVQTRTVRAIDIDDSDQAPAIRKVVDDVLARRLPARFRSNSGKVLLAFELPGGYTKRVIRTAHGIIEFLATGQQFVAVGTHPSGARYEWEGGLPHIIPALTPEEFEAVWSALAAQFAVESPTESKATKTRTQKLDDAVARDPVAVALNEQGHVLDQEKDGRLHITCPFADEHTTESSESATTYWPANTGGYQLGHFKCLHAHCEGRSDHDFLAKLGLAHDPRDDYEAIEVVEVPAANGLRRFQFVLDTSYQQGKPIHWLVKNILPKAELGVVYGPPGCGKSFLMFDIGMAIARGVEWNGRRVQKGRVAYIAAEGASGLRGRIKAYRSFHKLDEHTPYMHILAGVPNLLERQDVIDLGNELIRMGGVDLLVYDTLARGTTGGDENSAKDMGIAIANCRTLHDVTGAMVVPVHHSGKDTTRGARGSNAILGAADTEIAITREGEYRTMTVTKQKDGEDGAEFGFKLVSVPVGVDDDGDEVSSCVVEYGAVVNPSGREKKLGKRLERAMQAVLESVQVGDDAPSEDDVYETYKQITPTPEGRDQREAHCRGAIDTLVTMGRLRRVRSNGVTRVEIAGQS